MLTVALWAGSGVCIRLTKIEAVLTSLGWQTAGAAASDDF